MDSHLIDADLQNLFPNVTKLILCGNGKKLTPKVLQYFPCLAELHVMTPPHSETLHEEDLKICIIHHSVPQSTDQVKPWS